MAVAVPAGGALLSVAPLRDHVIVSQQDAVERLGGGDEFIAVLGEDDPVDQGVDARIRDAREVAGALPRGSL
jgi:hypothetical protein